MGPVRGHGHRLGLPGSHQWKLSVPGGPLGSIIWLLLISLPVPFLGRTTISWIVDTTTIGATIIYGFASCAVFKASKKDGARRDRVLSSICMGILVAFLLFLMLPGIISDQTIETETYILMTAWAILGLLFFNNVIRKDHARNFGKAIIEYIRSACMLLCNYFKHSPVYRIGGDEFAVLLQGSDYEARQALITSINEKIEENLAQGKVVASLGLAE